MQRDSAWGRQLDVVSRDSSSPRGTVQHETDTDRDRGRQERQGHGSSCCSSTIKITQPYGYDRESCDEQEPTQDNSILIESSPYIRANPVGDAIPTVNVSGIVKAA
jgi:hypothetical protein